NRLFDGRASIFTTRADEFSRGIERFIILLSAVTMLAMSLDSSPRMLIVGSSGREGSGCVARRAFSASSSIHREGASITAASQVPVDKGVDISANFLHRPIGQDELNDARMPTSERMQEPTGFWLVNSIFGNGVIAIPLGNFVGMLHA